MEKNKTNILKEYIFSAENRKRNLVTLGVFIILNLLIMNLYFSNAYYFVEASYPLIHAKVGNIYSLDYDYVFFIYLQDEIDSSRYNLAGDIPLVGYSYSGYSCNNNSVLIYDDILKTTSVDLDKKDVCSVYFDVINNQI